MDGGKKAASLLKQAVEADLQSIPLTAHHMNVVVRVYANVWGLSKTYADLEILPEQTMLNDFIRGFNMFNALFDYVDAGNGKECSDEKVKGKTPPRRHHTSTHTDLSKPLSVRTSKTCTVGTCILVAQPIMATLVYSGHL